MNGFDVVATLQERAETARIPVIVVTSKEVTKDDREKLRGRVSTIMQKGGFDSERFTSEVRRAMSGREATV